MNYVVEIGIDGQWNPTDYETSDNIEAQNEVRKPMADTAQPHRVVRGGIVIYQPPGAWYAEPKN